MLHRLVQNLGTLLARKLEILNTTFLCKYKLGYCKHIIMQAGDLPHCKGMIALVFINRTMLLADRLAYAMGWHMDEIRRCYWINRGSVRKIKKTENEQKYNKNTLEN